MQLEKIEFATGPNPQAAVIWLHGLGADGNDFAPIVPELDLDHDQIGHIRFIFPHAPMIPVTINNGYVMRAWYDILGTDLARREDEVGLRKSEQLISGLIDTQVASGIAADRIVLAGFSQGCAMTLLTGLRYPARLAALLALSGYLPLAASLAQERHAANASVPIFMAHGRQDPMISLARANASRDALRALGYAVSWKDYPMAHSVCAEELADIRTVLQQVLLLKPSK
jgi:phospholipase/carboxylesterase